MRPRSLHFGQSALLANLQASATQAAEQQATDYANQLYDQYQTQIWLGGIVLTGWILWVSWAALTVTHKVKG